MIIANKKTTVSATSALLVMAWTGVYFSKHDRNKSQESSIIQPKNNLTKTPIVYEFVMLDRKNASFMIDNNAKRGIIKGVSLLLLLKSLIETYYLKNCHIFSLIIE